MNRRADKIWVGLVMGILIPFLVMFIFYLSSYAYLTVPDFLRKMVFASIFFKVLSLCAIVNLVTFFMFYKTQNDKAARGVILATMIFAFAVVVNQILTPSL
tara:strand:- start:667 stop:969 length:303 start_codon:yes stop_codon:yes gene_type:complete